MGFNLKNEIINKLGDNLITRDFKNKSINRITINPELQNLLRNKYFGELVTLLNNN